MGFPLRNLDSFLWESRPSQNVATNHSVLINVGEICADTDTNSSLLVTFVQALILIVQS